MRIPPAAILWADIAAADGPGVALRLQGPVCRTDAASMPRQRLKRISQPRAFQPASMTSMSWTPAGLAFDGELPR